MLVGFDTVDFKEFHRRELPQRLAAGHGALAGAEAARLQPLGIRLRESGESYCYMAREGSVAIVPGDERAETLVEIDQDSWDGLAQDVETPPALIYSGRIKKLRGSMMHFVAWEPALRAMFHGRPIYAPENAELIDRHGRPLDPTHGFALDDDREDMAHFLRTAGYLFVKSVFSPEEVRAFQEQSQVLRERAVEGDQKSWWAKNAEGQSVLCRVLCAGEMPAFRPLPREPRLLRLIDLADEKLVPRSPDNVDGVTVLWKNPGVTEGLSDLPWHRDCGMGGHATMCPTIVCSIFIGSNTPEAGALYFLPGSWRASHRHMEPGDPAAPAGVCVPAGLGDVTLHYGDGMHAAPPPTSARGPFRAAVLTAYMKEGARHHRGERHYNDVLLGREDGQVEHMSKVADRY